MYKKGYAYKINGIGFPDVTASRSYSSQPSDLDWRLKLFYFVNWLCDLDRLILNQPLKFITCGSSIVANLDQNNYRKNHILISILGSL
jgi:hypothetical protein